MAVTKEPPKKTRRPRGGPRKYETQLESTRNYMRELSHTGRDIGPTASIVNVRRRNSCRLNLKKFCETYLEEAFPLAWSPIHLEMIARMEEAVLHGALYIFACPRATGKTTIARACALWAASYGHCRYVYLIGANVGKAQDSLDSIKTWMRFLPTYIGDFPEISTSIIKLEGQAKRAHGMHQAGVPTAMEWGKDHVSLPTVMSPPNLKGFKGKVAPTSGTRIGVSGLTGDGIRGSLKTLMDGSQLRPDFVLLDDPSTDESAKSPSQNETREALISGAVLGMAGPSKKISAVMPCTVIRQGDLADNLLDRSKHPLWRGTRRRLVDGWPEDRETWELYFEIYRMGALLEPPSTKEANKFYRKNRKAMDKGATATWPARKNDDEVSALQHAMNLYCRDPIVFASEYQNEPLLTDADSEFLTVEEIMDKQHAAKQNEVPLEVETIKCFVDVQKEQFYVQIWGYSARFDGFLLDYFSYPKQPVGYYTKKSIVKTLSGQYPKMGLEGRIYAGLNDLAEVLFAKRWRRLGDGAQMVISRVGIDSRYKTTTIRRFWRDNEQRDKILLCMGAGYGARKKPITQRPVKAGDRKGTHWFYASAKTRAAVRTLEIDTNYWKTFFNLRLCTAINDPGSFSLYKVVTAMEHRMVAEHFVSEYRTMLEGPYGKVDEYAERPGRPDNDFFDCGISCAAVASFDGVKMIGSDTIDKGEEQPAAVDWANWA